MFVLLNMLLFLVMVAFVAEDEHHMGITLIINSPNQLGTLVFFLLFLNWKLQICLFVTFFKESNMKNVKRYQIIEDRLFMEEYEDPDQQFWIH